jgi:NADH dehydrogenase FAD-containing subunit
MEKTRVVIAGVGFAGLSAAQYFVKTLARRSDVDVTLIGRETFILFTPMLHEAAAGDLSAKRSAGSNPRASKAGHVNHRRISARHLS